MHKILFLTLFTLISPQLLGQDSLIVKSIYFGGGSYYVEPDQIDEVEYFLSKFNNLEHYEVILFSHTDNIGSKAYNKWLSQMRSLAVYQELIKINVPKELIQIKDLGYDNPLYTNRTQSGRVKNRRVDIILSPITF